MRRNHTNRLSFHFCPIQDGNGYIDEHELDALLRDLYKKHKMVIWCWVGIFHHLVTLNPYWKLCVCPQVIDTQSLASSKKSIMALSDGGKLFRTELEIVLCKEPSVWALNFHFFYRTITRPKLAEVHVVALLHFLSCQSKSASMMYPSLCGMPLPEIWLLNHMCISCLSF